MNASVQRLGSGRGRANELTVGQIMSTALLECTPDTAVADAARRMAQQHNSSILVRNGDMLLGMWTEHDALRHQIAHPGAFDIPIYKVMSAPVATMPASTSVSDAAARFKRNDVRHYVVIDSEERPCGVVTQSDVVMNHGVEWFMRLQPVRSVLGERPTVAGPELMISQAAQRMYAHDRDALVVLDPDGVLGILTERAVVRYIAGRQSDRPAYEIASRPLKTVTRDDSLFYARNLMVAHGFRHIGVVDEEGDLIGLIGFGEILRTIEYGYIEELETALAERDSALRASEQRYRALVELSPDAIAVHAHRRILFINPAGAILLGADGPPSVVGRKFDDFLQPVDGDASGTRLASLERNSGSAPQEECLVRLDGRPIDVELSVTAITYNEQRAWQVVMRNITRRKQLERELRRLAITDQLTGIYNRPHFESHLDQAIREADRYGTGFSVLMFDIDRFKEVNDALGHDAGDRVLQDTVRHVGDNLRESDVFARWGGEEFMVLAPGIGADGAASLAEKIREALRRVGTGLDRPVTASFGVAVYDSNEDRERLIKRLDDALYRAKAGGRDRVLVAEPADGDASGQDPTPASS